MADARLDELWSQLLIRWMEEPAHQAFVEHCRSTRQLDEAARRYVEASRRPDTYREDGRPDEVAMKKLKLIAALATVDLETSRHGAEERARAVRRFRSRVRWIFLALVLVGILFSVASRR